ncbi:MAG: GNAT family N-acetyltransferase [Thermoanaerobaculia bacterium]
MNHDANVSVLIAGAGDAARVAPLFDAYRMFYGLPSALGAAQNYLHERLSREESIVLLATSSSDPDPLGFAQLYPTFSSLQLARTLVLNDLYVRPEARRRGVARALLLATHDIARQRGMVEISLETARTNHAAKPLYESEGYRTDAEFEHYHLSL